MGREAKSFQVFSQLLVTNGNMETLSALSSVCSMARTFVVPESY